MTILSHYTSRAGLEGIAQTGTLWATNFMEVNDTSEYFYAWEAILKNAIKYAADRIPDDIKQQDVDLDRLAIDSSRALRDYLKASPNAYGQLYTISFARGTTEDHERRGHLTLWDRYTRHEGYCLQFDSSEINAWLNRDLMKGNYASAGLSEVKYGIDEDQWSYKKLWAQVGEQFLVQIARAHNDSRISLDYINHWAPSTLLRKIMDYCGTRQRSVFRRRA